MTNGFTDDIVSFLLNGQDPDGLRRIVRTATAKMPSREYAAQYMKAAMFSALDPFVSNGPVVAANLLARVLNEEVDWEAVLDSVCTDPAMN